MNSITRNVGIIVLLTLIAFGGFSSGSAAAQTAPKVRAPEKSLPGTFSRPYIQFEHLAGNSVDSSAITGTVRLIIDVAHASAVTVFLESKVGLASRLGHAESVSGADNKWEFVWNSKTVADGTYELVLSIDGPHGTYRAVGREITVLNNPSAPTAAKEQHKNEKGDDEEAEASSVVPVAGTEREPPAGEERGKDTSAVGASGPTAEEDDPQGEEKDDKTKELQNFAESVRTCTSEDACARICATAEGTADVCRRFARTILIQREAMIGADIAADATSTAERAHTLQPEGVYRKVFAERIGVRQFADADRDMISDYDELNIYRTDPDAMDTDGDGNSDGEELINGTDPLSHAAQPVAYQDPLAAGEAADAVFEVGGITVQPADPAGDPEQLLFEGRGPARAVVTLYVFSTPIVVRVQTDENGLWRYTLDRVLADGSHQVYVAVTGGGGRVLAKSAPIPFLKRAGAVTIGEPAPPSSASRLSFWTSIYFPLTLLFIIIAIGFLLLSFASSAKKTYHDMEQLKHKKDFPEQDPKR